MLERFFRKKIGVLAYRSPDNAQWTIGTLVESSNYGIILCVTDASGVEESIFFPLQNVLQIHLGKTKIDK